MNPLLILFIVLITPYWITEDNDYYNLTEHYVMPSSRICGTVRQDKDSTVYDALMDGSNDSQWAKKEAAEKRVIQMCNDRYPDDAK